MRSKDRIALPNRFWQIFSSANSIRTENQSQGRQSTRFSRPKLARTHCTETNTQRRRRATTMSRRPTICRVLSQSMSTRFTGITQKAGGNLSCLSGDGSSGFLLRVCQQLCVDFCGWQKWRISLKGIVWEGCQWLSGKMNLRGTTSIHEASKASQI